jgi:hypothetical protein
MMDGQTNTVSFVFCGTMFYGIRSVEDCMFLLTTGRVHALDSVGDVKSRKRDVLLFSKKLTLSS